MKKFFAILLSAMLMLSLAVPAMAEGENPVTYKITVPEDDSHTYEVYQIFTGDYHDGILSNLVWGKNGKGTENEKVDNSVLDELEAVTNSTSDSAKLEVINQHVKFDSTAFGTVSKGNPLSVAPGYYLLKDANSLNGADDAYTTYIVQIVADVTVARKAAKPSVDKQVWDEAADGETRDESWGETADHEINETFQFKLIATLPADVDFAAYKEYKVIFNDTMSAGITFESIESVTVDGKTVNAGDAKTDYKCSAVEGDAGKPWTLTIENIKGISGVDLTDGATIEVIYNAHLNENAKIENEKENKNTVNLQYSNNPNAGGEGELGKTTDDTVWVFTYQVDVTKVDGEKTDKYLEGAEFKMKNAEGKWLVVENGKVKEWVTEEPYASVLKSDANGKFSVIGLDHGEYELIETKAPAGYNLLEESIKVTIEATHTENTDESSAKTTITKDSTMDITVKNNAGAVLPETGGMGTTIFYIVGGLMVVAAVVLLVTKKRMSAEG